MHCMQKNEIRNALRIRRGKVNSKRMNRVQTLHHFCSGVGTVTCRLGRLMNVMYVKDGKTKYPPLLRAVKFGGSRGWGRPRSTRLPHTRGANGARASRPHPNEGRAESQRGRKVHRHNGNGKCLLPYACWKCVTQKATSCKWKGDRKSVKGKETSHI